MPLNREEANRRVGEEWERFTETFPSLIDRSLRGRWIVFLGGEVRSTHKDVHDAYQSALEVFGIDACFVLTVVHESVFEPVCIYTSTDSLTGGFIGLGSGRA